MELVVTIRRTEEFKMTLRVQTGVSPEDVKKAIEKMTNLRYEAGDVYYPAIPAEGGGMAATVRAEATLGVKMEVLRITRRL